MMKRLPIALCTLALLATPPLLPLGAAEPSAGAVTRPAAATYRYGKDPLQTIDYWAPVRLQTGSPQAPAPLVLFVHGGGWKRGDKDNATGQWKIRNFTGAGYAFASINYRLVPAARVEQQAQDVADALAALIRRRAELGLAPGKAVLMGHSAGAHLVALVGSDPQYLQRAGLSFSDIAGIVSLDGAAYDVPAQLADGPRIMHKTYLQAFGSEPGRQRALSPTLQAAAPNAPAFLLLHVGREDGTAQAQALAKALRAGGTPVAIEALPGKGLRGHMEINRRLGDPAYPGTALVDDWLAQRFR